MATRPRISENALAHLLLLAMTAIWGAMFIVVKQALANIAPQWFNAARMAIAFLALALIYRQQFSRLTRAAWLSGATAGAAMAGGYFFQTQGLRTTTATHSAFLTATVVIIVPLMASVPGLRARNQVAPRAPAWAGAILAFAGVLLLTTPARTPWPVLLETLNRGDLLSLACAVGFALQIIVLSRSRAAFEQLTLLQVGFAMVLLTIAAGLTEPFRPHSFIASGVLPALLIAGLFATALAFSVQTWAQQIIPASNIAIIVTLEPVFATLFAFAVLGERLSARGISGALLILSGVLVAELLPRRFFHT